MQDGRGTQRAEQPPVLLVEDDVSISMLARSVLEDEGYAVLAAASGDEALKLLDSAAVGLILLDMRLPDMDGEAFLAACRQRWERHPPVVAFTAMRPRQDPLPLGVVDWLEKPFNIDDLTGLVAAHYAE